MRRLLDSAPGRLLSAYFASSVQSYAAGLAFNAFVTMFPLILGVLSVIGFVARSRPLEAEVVRAILNAFPADFHPTLRSSLREVSLHAATFGIVSAAGIVWAGTGLFASLEFALNRIYGAPARSFLRRRLLGLRLIVVFVLAVVASVALNGAIAVVHSSPLLVWLVGFFGGWTVMSVLLAWVYVAAPNCPVPVRSALPGALAAGLAIEVFSLAFPLFSAVTHETNVYGRGLALMFVLLTWLYVLCQLLLIGAVFNRVRSELGKVPEREKVAALVLAQDPDRGHLEGKLRGAGDV